MSDQIVVSENALASLNATRPWVKFLAIMGFIGIGLMVLAGLVMTFAFSMIPTKPGMPQFGPAIGIIYLIFAGIYLMPTLFLYRYSKAIAAIPSAGQGALEEALKNQKSFWKFMGIVVLIIVCLELLVLVIALLAGLAVGFMHH